MTVARAIEDDVFLPFHRSITEAVIGQIPYLYRLDDQRAAAWLDDLRVPLHVELRERP